jgi:hypothetical protein
VDALLVSRRFFHLLAENAGWPRESHVKVTGHQYHTIIHETRTVSAIPLQYLLFPHVSNQNCFGLAMASFPIPSLQKSKFAPHGGAPASVACSPVICLITRSPAFPKPAKMVKCLVGERTSCVPITDPGIYTRLVEKMFAW